MKRLLSLLALFCCAAFVSAQEDACLSIKAQHHVRLPWGVSNISVADGRLYCISEGVVLSSPLEPYGLLGLQPDTLVGRFDDHIDYVTLNPRDGCFYYTTTDRSGRQRFMMRQKNKNRRVELSGWNFPVGHPAFSPDGNVLVFSSAAKVGMGGTDLWCSIWDGRRWSKPINLGSAINTFGNEVRPAFYGNYLVFASDRDGGSYSLYSVRISPNAKVDDIIFGNYLVQPLPMPLNGRSDNMDVAVDTISHRGFWLSNRRGKNELYAFNGRLDGVLLVGRVVDEADASVSAASVRAFSKGREVASATTDVNGEYSLFLQPGLSYQVKISKDNYYNFSHDVTAVRRSERCLLSVDTLNVVLKTLSFSHPIMLDGVYSGAEVELSAKAVANLQHVVDFIRDNPQVKTNFLFYYEQTADTSFNNMIIERRINGLREYLQSVLPKGCPISYENASQQAENENEISGVNTLFVIFSK